MRKEAALRVMRVLVAYYLIHHSTRSLTKAHPQITFNLVRSCLTAWLDKNTHIHSCACTLLLVYFGQTTLAPLSIGIHGLRMYIPVPKSFQTTFLPSRVSKPPQPSARSPYKLPYRLVKKNDAFAEPPIHPHPLYKTRTSHRASLMRKFLYFLSPTPKSPPITIPLLHFFHNNTNISLPIW